MNQIIIQKYGGSSVANTERIQHVTSHIIEQKKKGFSPVVVVSAMGDSTDHLIELAKSITPNPSSREMDMLLSTGEQISISLLAMAIESKGYKAISLTGYQCGIQTDPIYSKAKINEINTERIMAEINADKIVIVAGFQGINSNGDITTLGRGGSDTTAVALAVALNAELCEIYTDVKGIYTADPRVVKDAALMQSISYDEMLELAKLGAKVMHPRSVELARKNNMKLVVRSSFELDHHGTIIKEVKQMEKAQVRGVTLDDNIVRLTVSNVPDKPGIAYKMFSALAAQNVHIDMIIQNLNHDDLNDISFTIPKDELYNVKPTIDAFVQEVNASELLIRTDVAKLSIVGTGITSDATIASGLFGALYQLGINIEMISTSEIKISCIIDEKQANEALSEIHNFFQLNKVL
ncbi:aspartate kinase [Fusibacter ferrireducens]|uniref:Aspartokinase n=1 Tax=Fusibacter ferrireducens TaxID=2785058 RepID=A0ABR9ZWE3_9FIRM|nr:aspartate kinase [Fusibacter ferrireducens]MBF4694769.1 aspartate kinase [Fusibacter ferrireducens]